MRKLLLLVPLMLLSAPALAQIDLGVQKEAMLLNKKQETIPVGDNRFLIFSGMPDEQMHYGYTIDLVKIENGAPRFDPLFMEDFDPDSGRHTLSEGAAFFAQSYNYDRITNTLDYTSQSTDGTSRIQYKYHFEGDTLSLKQVVTQKVLPCSIEPCRKPIPKVVYQASEHAQAH